MGFSRSSGTISSVCSAGIICCLAPALYYREGLWSELRWLVSGKLAVNLLTMTLLLVGKMNRNSFNFWKNF